MASADFKTPIGRFSYVQNMFTRVAKKDDAGNSIVDANGKGVTEQQCTLIFDKTADRKPFENAIAEAIREKWGEPGIEKAKKGLIRLPFLAGDGKEAHNKKTGELNAGLGADKWFIRVATRREAPVRFRSANVPATYGTSDDQIKSGDYGFAVLHAYAWSNSKNGDGVSFGIVYLQKTKAGESLGGTGPDAETYYEAIADEGAAPEATKSGAGAGGLFG